MKDEPRELRSLRIIRTARTLAEINQAVDGGFFPLVRELMPSGSLYATYCVFRNRKTNRIETAEAEEGYAQYGRGLRHFKYSHDEWEMVISYSKYYPHKFPGPFAAYLIPPDISIDERVTIEDLIEDYYGGSYWSEKIRLETLEAIWDGSELVIQYDPDVDGVCSWVG